MFRTALIGLIILALAAGGHLAGDGQLPQGPILAALCAITVIPVAAVTRFRLTFPVLIGLLGAGQLWLHWAFNALSAGVPAPASQAFVPSHPGHPGSPPVHASFAMLTPTHSAPDLVMFAAHSVATLGSALLLARGEQTLGVLASWLLRPLLQQPERAAVVPVRVPAPGAEPEILPPAHHGLRLPPWRGPPAFAPAARSKPSPTGETVGRPLPPPHGHSAVRCPDRFFISRERPLP